MNFNYIFAKFTLALLFPICISGCGPALKTITQMVAKAGAKSGSKAAVKGAVSGTAKVAASSAVSRTAKLAASSADDAAKLAASSADDVALKSGQRSSGVIRNGAGHVANVATRSAAQVAARLALKTAASQSMDCREKLSAIKYESLPRLSRVTMRVLIQRYMQNKQRLEELDQELNDPSLSYADAERIRDESERGKRELDRINEKADALYREFG